MHWNQRRFKEKLLSRTLRYAYANVRHYRDGLPKGLDPFGLSLDDFPILEPKVFKENPAAFMHLDRFPDFATTTGGTTGRPAILLSFIDEYDAWVKTTTGVRRGEMLDPLELESTGLTIHLIDALHGGLVSTQHGWPMLNLPLEHYGHGEIIEHFLQNGIEVAHKTFPVATIQGSTTKLKMLTAFLAERGFDAAPSASRVRSIVSYGWHLSRFWTEKIESFWGAPVTTRFGQTEFNFDCPFACEECGRYHFEIAFAEYLHPATREPVADGDAVLAYTSLLPYCRGMPRIRYWTGDVVSVGLPCERAGGEQGCEFRGRLGACVLVSDGTGCRTVLGAIDVMEALDGLPGVRTREELADAFFKAGERGRAAPFAVGPPAFSIAVEPSSLDPKQISLMVESDADPAPAGSLADEIVAALEEVRPGLLEELHGHGIDFELQIVAPDGIAAQQRRLSWV